MADLEIRGSKQPYHFAEPMPIAKAKEFLKRCTESTYQLAVAGLMTIATELKRSGHEVAACAMIGGSGRRLGSIEAILAAHPAIHTAEGERYRDAIAHACKHRKLPLAIVRQKELPEMAEAALGMSRKYVEEQLLSLGKTVGTPWAEDQKLAALAAWVAMATASRRPRKMAALA